MQVSDNFKEEFRAELIVRYSHTPKLKQEFIEIHSGDVEDIINIATELHETLIRPTKRNEQSSNSNL